MVLGFVLVNFMDRNGSVYDRRLDCFLLNNWLNVLMNMVVDMLASNSLGLSGAALNIAYFPSAFELSSLRCKTFFDMTIVSVFDVALLNSTQVVCMFLG